MLKESDILTIISKALDDGSGVKIIVSIEDSMDTISEWDSLGHLSILSALDQNLEGKVSQITDISDCTSVSKLIDTLKANNLINN